VGSPEVPLERGLLLASVAQWGASRLTKEVTLDYPDMGHGGRGVRSKRERWWDCGVSPGSGRGMDRWGVRGAEEGKGEATVEKEEGRRTQEGGGEGVSPDGGRGRGRVPKEWGF